MKVPHAYIIKKIILVETYGYLNCATYDSEINVKVLHQPPEKIKLHNEKNA